MEAETCMAQELVDELWSSSRYWHTRLSILLLWLHSSANSGTPSSI